jgi:ADP-ribosylglycohydrolase
MTSDDTEHTCLVGQALLRESDIADRFSRILAWGLRGWLASLPAGIGKATLLACLKLWLGFPPGRSGIWSAGNGPAMRAALLGVYLGDDREKLRTFVRASTRLTHTDPRAERGAYLVALAAYHGARNLDAREYLSEARLAVAEDAPLVSLLNQLEGHLARQTTVGEFAAALGLADGVSGYIYHTVPVVLYAWLRWPDDIRRAVEEVIVLGGDADSTGAIIGGLMGATLGASAIPAEWLKLCEWPRSVGWMRKLAAQLAQAPPHQPVRLLWPALWPRNLFFLLIVLGHLIRRCLPPYTLSRMRESR